MRVDKKTVLKNLFFAFAVWSLGFIVVSFFGAAWAAASKWEPMLHVFMVTYMLVSTVFFGWVLLDFVRKHAPRNGRHHGEAHSE